MSDARLARHEFGYDRRAFLRDPQALFFSVGLPLLHVVIFVSCSATSRSTSCTSLSRAR